jgi:hypothetical protein
MTTEFSADQAFGALSAPRPTDRVSPLEDAAFQAARTPIARQLSKGAAAVVRAVGEAVAAAEALWAGVRATPAFVLGSPPAACRKGCGWCCHQRVGAAAVEVLSIAAALRARPDAADLARRLSEWRPGQPCALLKDGACGIYEVRPLKCRGLYHADARWCAKTYAKLAVPGFGPEPSRDIQAAPKEIFDGAVKGIALAFHQAGRPCAGVEFMPALGAVFDRPDAAEAWWRGEAVFPAEATLDWFPALAKPGGKPAGKKRR